MKRALQQLRSARLKRNPNIEFRITHEDVWRKYDLQEGKCALSGLTMENYRDGSGIKNPYNISIDRIESDLPYTPDNIQLVCQAINMMKGTLDDNEFIRLCRAVAFSRSDFGERTNKDSSSSRDTD